MSFDDPKTGSRATVQQPSNSEEAKPSRGGIERRGSVRTTGNASSSCVVPTHKVPSAYTRGLSFRQGDARDDLAKYCNLGD